MSERTTNEALLFQQIDRQNYVIDILLKENACFKQIIQTYLLNDFGTAKPELAWLKMMIDNSYPPTFSRNMSDGKNGSLTSSAGSGEGMSNIHTSFTGSSGGINGKSISFGDTGKGNSGLHSSSTEIAEGNMNENISKLAGLMRPFMKYSVHKSLVNTAKILWRLYQNPLTPLSGLRTLTGLSQDGMAKRIMALKRYGLIVRYSAPLRCELTQKARNLLEAK